MKKTEKRPARKLNRTKAGDIINLTLLLLFTFICLYPFWYIFIGSITNPNIPARTLTFLPREVTLYNYKEVFKMKGMLHAVWISVARTVLGTTMNVLLTSFLAYLFTRKDMPLKKLWYRIIIITMYVSGGLIPGYLVTKAYGLVGTFWVYVIPGMMGAYDMVLIKTFMENGIPDGVVESAILDGAGPVNLYTKIILPLSKPILATISLFGAVGAWNDWYQNMIYCANKPELTTLQFLLYQKLNEASRMAERAAREANFDPDTMVLTPDSVRMTMTMVITLPILLVYPFLQKYFQKGIMVGAIKG